MGNGIIRSFSRLGIGAAALVSFGGAAVTTMVASDQYYKAELESGVGRIPALSGIDRSPLRSPPRSPRSRAVCRMSSTSPSRPHPPPSRPKPLPSVWA